MKIVLDLWSHCAILYLHKGIQPANKKEKKMNYTATLTFKTNTQANEFAVAWTRKSFMGHTISTDGTVSIYGITEELKHWIDGYVTKINKGA